MEKKFSKMEELRKKYANYNYLEEEIKAFNNNVGTLGYLDCPICKNKGYVAINEHEEMKLRKCECMKQRNIYKQLEICGIPLMKQKECTFDNIWENEEWQKIIKYKAMNFCNTEDYKKNWFILYGFTGSGKTTVCTTMFLELIKKGCTGKYLLWNDEITNLTNLKNNYNDLLREEYDEKINYLKKVDVLYIDDLLKLTPQHKTTEHLSILYEILNYRYSSEKTTIITTELTKDQLEKMDMAICGRIYEKCKNGFYELKSKNEPDRNQRYKMNVLNKER